MARPILFRNPACALNRPTHTRLVDLRADPNLQLHLLGDSAESSAAERDAAEWPAVQHASAESSAYIAGGVAIPTATARRLSCDAGIVTLLERVEGKTLSIGRRRRTIPPAIRRALQTRDAGCRFPGCTHPHFLHAHHIQHWAAGGHTSVKNLVTLCSYHDKLVHEGGFSLQRAADGQLVFRTPSGHPIALAPTSPGGSAGSLAIDNAQFGINVSAETGAALWDGACVDYEHVLFTFFAGGSQVGTRAAAG